MLTPTFRDETADRLLALLDGSPESAAIAARSNLCAILMELEKPSESHMLMLAKMQVSETGVAMDNQLPIVISMSKRVDIVRCGMLNICLAIAKSWASSFNKLTQVCIDLAAECAPLSALLLGLLIERGGRMLGIHGFAVRFVDLCKDQKEDVRATATFLIGCSNDPAVIPVLDGLVADPSPLVREQVMFAMANLAKNQVDRRGLRLIDQFAGDTSEVVRKSCDALKHVLGQMKAGMGKDQQSPNPILKNLIRSVKAHGFAQRYRQNIFEVADGE
jgi:hypothetical protein